MHHLSRRKRSLLRERDDRIDHSAPEPEFADLHADRGISQITVQNPVGSPFQNARQKKQKQRKQEDHHAADTPESSPCAMFHGNGIPRGVRLPFRFVLHSISLLTAPYSTVRTARNACTRSSRQQRLPYSSRPKQPRAKSSAACG